MQVLVLDDSDLIRKILVDILLDIGLQESEIQDTNNGTEALQKLNSHTFDLLLLDVVMDGIGGIAVLKESKKIQPKAKVIMCSTFSKKDIVKKAIDLGVDDFVVKPFEERRLKETLLRNLPPIAASGVLNQDSNDHNQG